MPVELSARTRWECIRCGKCCTGIIPSKDSNLAVEKDGKLVCKHLDLKTNQCTIYDKRPFICRLYPFVLDLDNIVDSLGIARPAKAFEKLQIHTETSGFGKGKRIRGNRKIQKELNELSMEFSLKFKEAFEKKIDISQLL